MVSPDASTAAAAPTGISGQAAGGPAAGLRRRAARLWTRAATDSMVRNAGWLIVNLLVQSGVGFLFTLLAARLYPPAVLGVSTSAISATLLVVTVAGLGLGQSMLRLLPATEHRPQMVNTGLTVSTAAVLACAGVFLLVPPASGELLDLAGPGLVPALAVGCVVMSLQGLLETVLVANRSAGSIVAVNAASSAVRLGALVLFLPLGALSVYLAQSASLAVSLLALAVLLARRGHTFRLRVDRRSVRELWRLSAASYLSNLLGALPALTLPLLLLARLGPADVAFWYVAFSVANLLFMLPGMVSRSLLAEGSYREAGRLALLRRGSGLILLVMAPALTVAYVGAPWLLAAFGDAYAGGATAALRLLVLSAVLVAANYVLGTVLFLAKRVLVICLVNLANAATTLGLVAYGADSVADVAGAWLVGEVVNVVLFGAGAWAVVRRHRTAWGEDVP